MKKRRSPAAWWSAPGLIALLAVAWPAVPYLARAQESGAGSGAKRGSAASLARVQEQGALTGRAAADAPTLARVQDRDAPPKSDRPEAGIGYERQFEKIWQTVREHFYDENLHGVDWKRIGQETREKVRAVTTRSEFAALMNRMLAALDASHTHYFTEDDMEFFMLPSVIRGDLKGRQAAHIGIMGRREEEGFRVTGVLEQGPAEAAGIRRGDLLMRAEDDPFTTVGAFREKEGREVAVTLRRDGSAEPQTVQVRPRKQNLLQAFLDATAKSARTLNVGGKRIGYVHLWAMAHPEFRDTLEKLVLGRLYATDGLILDLRDGFGGRPEGYADVFFRPDVSWEQRRSRGKPYVVHTGYSKPMVLLINEGTRSAKEAFTHQMKVGRRAAVVGTRTAGAFLGAGMFPIGEDGLLELAVLGLRLDRKRLEGEGVEPDVTVQAGTDGRRRDMQLERAQQELLKRIQRRDLAQAVLEGEESHECRQP